MVGTHQISVVNAIMTYIQQVPTRVLLQSFQVEMLCMKPPSFLTVRGTASNGRQDLQPLTSTNRDTLIFFFHFLVQKKISQKNSINQTFHETSSVFDLRVVMLNVVCQMSLCRMSLCQMLFLKSVLYAKCRHAECRIILHYALLVYCLQC